MKLQNSRSRPFREIAAADNRVGEGPRRRGPERFAVRLLCPLILHFVRLGFPFREYLLHFLPQDLLLLEPTLRNRLGQFAIELLIIEPRLCGIMPRAGEYQPLNTRPISSPKAHWAGLATAIQHAPSELKGTEL